MRYEDARRLHAVEGWWFRISLWFRPFPHRRQQPIGRLDFLSDHERRDIGLPEPVRYVDWRLLRENGWQ